MTLIIITFGFLFGAVLQYAKLNKFNTISGIAILQDLTVAKAIAVAIGIGAILLNIEIALGLATYHVKPFGRNCSWWPNFWNWHGHSGILSWYSGHFTR